MKVNISDTMIALLKLALISDFQYDASDLDGQDVSKLYALSKSHDLAHLVGMSLDKAHVPLSEEIAAKFQKQSAMATYRCLGMQIEMERIDGALEKAGIPYMPLKGTVIRSYYPMPEMRTSSDIDILVHEEDLDRAVSVMCDTLGYRVTNKSTHDISLFSPGGVHVELHFSLSENDEKMDAVLLTVWKDAEVEKGYRHRYRMSNEMFFVYCVSHMAKHFVGGGCGVRPFMDLYIMQMKMGYDTKKAGVLLAECNLTVFAEQALYLCEVWFGKAEHTQLSREMHNYIMSGGVYGNAVNRIAVSSSQKGRFRYTLSRIFLSYGILKVYYPRLAKCPILYPYYTVKRWCKVLFKRKNRTVAMAELKQTASPVDEQTKRTAKLCKMLKLI